MPETVTKAEMVTEESTAMMTTETVVVVMVVMVTEPERLPVAG